MNCLKRKQKRNLNKLFEKGCEFLKNIKNEKVALVYHKDVDGICSCILFSIALKKLGIEVATVPTVYRKFAKTIRSLKFDKLIVVDIGMSQEFALLFKKPVLIIDHHLIKEDINSDRIIFINPRFEEAEIYQPASYISYKFLSKIVDLEDREWLAVLGTISDYGFEDCKDLIKKHVDLNSIKTKDELLEKTKFGKAATALTAAMIEFGVEKAMKILLISKNLDEILENENIKNVSVRHKALFEKYEKEFWENSETIGEIIFSIIKPSKEGIASNVVNEVSRKNPNKIILLFEELDDKYNIDARCQSGRIHLGKLMEKTCGGGGHRNAAGGLIKKSDLEDFKNRVMKELKMKI